MRFMLLQNYGEVESDCPPMAEWTPEDIKAHIDFQQTLNDQLTQLGELGVRVGVLRLGRWRGVVRLGGVLRLLLRPPAGLAPRHAVGHGGGRAGDDRGAGHPAEQSGHVESSGG